MLKIYNKRVLCKRAPLCKITFRFKIFAIWPPEKLFENRDLSVLTKGVFCFEKLIKKLCSKPQTKGKTKHFLVDIFNKNKKTKIKNPDL